MKFPKENSGQDMIKISTKINTETNEEEFEMYDLSLEEKLALTQIDLMKTEITSIYKSENNERTTVSYALSKEKENKMHDDRFYVAILLAHRLYEIRRGSAIRTTSQVDTPLFLSRPAKSYRKQVKNGKLKDR